MTTTRTTTTVAIQDVREDDFLPGLDRGYVFQDPEPAHEHVAWMGQGFPFELSEDLWLVTFHTRDGEEAYLIGPADMPVTVERR